MSKENDWLVKVMNETRKKEALRNNPDKKPHEYSAFCSCASCHAIGLYADAIKKELVAILPKEKELEFDCLGNPMPINKVIKNGYNQC